MSNSLKLYEFPKSSASYRVRIALNLKGLEYESHIVNFRENAQRSEEYLQISPAGLVPALELNGIRISQSLAILRYLDRLCDSPILFPTDDRQFIVDELSMVIACDIHPINNLRILKYLKGPMLQDDDSVNKWYRHWITQGFEGLEKRLETTAGKYCVGDEITAADVCLVPQVFNARRYETPLEAFPNIVRIEAALKDLSSFEDAAP